MKLNEIKKVLSESTTPIHITMILQEVVEAGKVTNTAQYLVLAQLVGLFKFKGVNANNQVIKMAKLGYSDVKPRYVYENPTTKELLDELKSLSGEDQAKLAEWFLIQLAAVESLENLERWNNPQMGLSHWISWVNKSQD